MAVRPFGSKGFVLRNNDRDASNEPESRSILNSSEVITGAADEVRGDDSAAEHSTNGEGGFIDPTSANPNSDSGDAPYGKTASGRVRKRPVGTKASSAGTTRKGASETTSDLANILFSLHMMGAAFLKSPSLMLTEEEAQNLGAAVVRVTELYDIPLMDEKTRAWTNLGIVAAGVYGTRIASAMIDRKKRPTQQARQGMGVVEMPNAGGM